MMENLTGTQVVESPVLPLEPSPGQWARRYVRHGLADVLAWLGEEVGPKPDDVTHVMMVGPVMFASAAAIKRMREEWWH